MAEFNIPGVYSTVDPSAAVQALSANTSVFGIVATATTGDDNKTYAPINFDDAKTKYGADSNIVKLMKVAMNNGGNRFIVVKVDETDTDPDYETALDALLLEEAVNIILVDSTDATVHKLVKEHCVTASENRRERIAFVGLDAGADVASANTAASELNSGRVYIVYPNLLDINGDEVSGIFGAAAYAGSVAAETDPSMPMTGVEIKGFYGLAKKLKDSELNSLIEGGVTPLETLNGSIQIVRAVSTYTKNKANEIDITWQELTTTRISDFVMKDMRNRLTKKFRRAKQNKKGRDSVRSEVINCLEDYERLEYIENVNPETVTIQINPANPTRNDVNFEYDVVTPMNVIHLTGHLII